MGRKKKLPVLERITITDIGAEGKAIARIDNQVLFVPMLIPGDIADIRVTRKKRNYMEGIAVKVHQYSHDRIKPLCSHFGTCGGCKWQHLPYAMQLRFKEKQVSDNLTRIGKLKIPDLLPAIGSLNEYYYRNKLEYTFSARRWLSREEINSAAEIQSEPASGFHIPGLFDKVLDIKKCFLQPEPTNEIRNAVKQFALENDYSFFNLKDQEGFLRNLIIRNTIDGQVMVILVFFYHDDEKIRMIMEFIRTSFPALSSLMYVVNRKRNDSLSDQVPVLYSGKDHLVETLLGLRFRIGPKSFCQTNTLQAENLYRTVRKFAALNGNEIVYDLYTGTGTIACLLACEASKVIGIEYVAESIEDARVNAELNGIVNLEFITGDLKNVLSGTFFAKHGKPDVLITDPPRAGMHSDVIEAIIDAAPARIVYVSCNPATQARDISLLSERYSVSAVQPLDMFPHTAHIENVALLVLQSSYQS